MTERPATLAEAMTAFQAELPHITKDDKAQVGSRETRYANLASISELVLPMLAGLGLYWTCAPTLLEDKTFVLSYALRHVAGDEISGEYPLPSGTPQTMGGAITYARRYALCAVLGIAPAEDDDDAQAQAEEARDRQNTRTRYIAEERAAAAGTSRPADRSKGRLPDDDWTTGVPGILDTPGSMRDDERRKLMALYADRGLVTSEQRHEYMQAKLGTAAPEKSSLLSRRQAGQLIAHLEAEAQ